MRSPLPARIRHTLSPILEPFPFSSIDYHSSLGMTLSSFHRKDNAYHARTEALKPQESTIVPIATRLGRAGDGEVGIMLAGSPFPFA